MNYFFSKDFNNSSDFDKMFDLGIIEYYKCEECGFVASKDHFKMDTDKWENLNFKFHNFIENNENPLPSNQPPYLMQATLINILNKHHLIKRDFLDWGAGYGTLSKILSDYYAINIFIYDKYIHNDDQKCTINYVTSEHITTHKYNTVINSAMFEHVTNRNHLDNINNCVSELGCLFIHTVICEEIPCDPDWFYLLPVHCAFHTNRSMQYLMKQWQYDSSIYCPLAKSWILFKNNDLKIQDTVDQINNSLQSQFIHFKNSFMDYWK